MRSLNHCTIKCTTLKAPFHILMQNNKATNLTVLGTLIYFTHPLFFYIYAFCFCKYSHIWT